MQATIRTQFAAQHTAAQPSANQVDLTAERQERKLLAAERQAEAAGRTAKAIEELRGDISDILDCFRKVVRFNLDIPWW